MELSEKFGDLLAI
jgi:hypothetical protein